MNKIFSIQKAEKCWKLSLNWTFRLLDILDEVYGTKGKITDVQKAKQILRSAKSELFELKDRINAHVKEINIHVKPVRNFRDSLEKLLNSTEVNFSKMKVPPKPFDLFDSIEDEELGAYKLDQCIQITKKTLEKNWVAFSQNYGRMLIKMKLNGYSKE